VVFATAESVFVEQDPSVLLEAMGAAPGDGPGAAPAAQEP
jgi:hypothetical protein